MPNHPTNPKIRLIDGAFYAEDPHRYFTWMRENAPVYWDASARAWGIALYEDVMFCSKNPEIFSNAGGIRADAPSMPFMINLDDPLHNRRRNLVNRGFTKRRVQEREARIREICVELIEKAKAMRRFDVVMDIAAWLPLIVIGDMLGVDPADYPTLLRWSDDLVLGTGAITQERMNRAAEAFEEYERYQRAVIAARRAQPPREDLISILVHAEIDGEKLTDDEILWEALLILIGGDETTRHVISGGVYQLLQNPDQLARLRRCPARIVTAVEEMLRWVTPIQNMARTATRDLELRGQKILAGDKLLLLYPSANRDASVFTDPFRFDIERNPNPHIAFGFGAHFCLGASLARLELKVFFEEFVQRMPELRLLEDGPPPLRASNFISGIEHLLVEVRG